MALDNSMSLVTFIMYTLMNIWQLYFYDIKYQNVYVLLPGQLSIEMKYFVNSVDCSCLCYLRNIDTYIRLNKQ